MQLLSGNLFNPLLFLCWNKCDGGEEEAYAGPLYRLLCFLKLYLHFISSFFFLR